MAGVATAYPHPNQFFYNKVKKGEPVYVNTDIKLGGYGGEGYRNYQIAPVSAHQEKMWQVVADCVQIQVEETRPGVTCSEVAYKIHRHQVKEGMQDYIYHRPAHGAGQNFEGHQPQRQPAGHKKKGHPYEPCAHFQGVELPDIIAGDQSSVSLPETKTWAMSISPRLTSTKGLPFFKPTVPNPVAVARKLLKSLPILESIYSVLSTAS